MEGDNDIFLAVNDNVLGYLAGSLDKKYPTTFIWAHSLSTCGSYDQFCDPSYIPPCLYKCTFKVPPPFAHLLLSRVDTPLSRSDFARLP